MRVLGVKSIDPVSVFDRYTGNVYFPGGFLRQALTCKFEDVEVLGAVLGTGSAKFVARPKLRRPWSLTPKVIVTMYIGDHKEPARMWQMTERFMNTPLGHLLPFAPGSSDRILAYRKLGLTVPEVHPPGLSEFDDDSLSHDPWWKAASRALAKRGQQLSAQDYLDWADFEMDDAYAYVEHEARTHGVLTEWEQRDKEWREKREREQSEWRRWNTAFRTRLRSHGVRLSDEQQPDTGN